MKSTHRLPRARGMTLLELTVVILVLLSLISILFVGARAWKVGSERAGCVMNIRNAQQAVRSYQNLNQVPEYAVIDMFTDLIGPGKFMERDPVCPGGGHYEHIGFIPPSGVLAISCSLAGPGRHSLEADLDW